MKNVSVIAQQFDIGKITYMSENDTGLINQTFFVETRGSQKHDKYILQKLHNQIGKEVIIDINEITRHLAKKGFLTPALVRSLKGELFIEDNNKDIWRVLTFIDGRTLDKLEDKTLAQSAGLLIGRFHTALLDCNHIFLHKIANFHDTEWIVTHMKNLITKQHGNSELNKLKPLTNFVINEYQNIRYSLSDLPERIIHGDLKLSNIMFDKKSNEAIALVDLDSIGRNKIAIDIGDALRSICNVENKFDLETFTYFLDGYLSESTYLKRDETLSIIAGVQTIILELAARYISDAIEQSYFKLDERKYPNLYNQNKSKAESNIELYEDFEAKRTIVESTINNYL